MVLLLLALPLLVLLALPAPISAFDWSLETAIGTSIERRHQLDMPVSTAPPIQASTSCYWQGWLSKVLSFSHTLALKSNPIMGPCAALDQSTAQISVRACVCLLPLPLRQVDPSRLGPRFAPDLDDVIPPSHYRKLMAAEPISETTGGGKLRANATRQGR